jgi:mannosyl-oligosaccharide alpha-1,3-glucosidase
MSQQASPPSKSAFSVDTSSEWRSVDAYTTSMGLQNRAERERGNSDVRFSVEMTSYERGTFRLKIVPREARVYELGDEVLVKKFISGGKVAQRVDSARRTIRFDVDRRGSVFVHNDKESGEEENAHEAAVEFDASALCWHFSIDGERVVSINRRALLSVEHRREKPAASDDEADADGNTARSKYAEIDSSDGGWDETFGSHVDSKPFGPQSVGVDIAFVGATHVYGVPEHATSLRLKSTRGAQAAYDEPYRLYNLDVFEYELDNPMALYGSVPIMLAHSAAAGGRTVGVFWANVAETWVDVDVGESDTDTHWFSESGVIDVFVMLGPRASDVFGAVAALTGEPTLPPLFSIAYHQCRWNYKSEDDVALVDSSFDGANMPYDVVWLDIEHTDGKRYFTWDRVHFPTPEHMIDDVDAKGRRMVTIVDPHIKRDDKYHVHRQASDGGHYVRKADGVAEYEGWCWPGASSYVDFTSPSARFWWEEQFGYEQYRGSRPSLMIWNDMNEPSVFNGPEVSMHKDARHHGGWEHRDVHNLVGALTHRATALGLVKRNDGHNMRPFVLSRAFYAGTQRWGAIWTGDNTADWQHLAASNPMLLSIGLVGIPFAGADVGGFFGNPDAELQVRWYQAGAYQPFFRGHAHLDAKRREPYLLDEPHRSHVRDALRARYALLPYWYTAFAETHRTGAPVMQPLWVAYPTDEATFDIDDQFLIGDDLLVKPVAERGQQSTSVYLPAEHLWYDVDTLTSVRRASGATRVHVNTPLAKIPVFQRGGSIIARKERPRRSTTQMANDPFTLAVALDQRQSAAGRLYLDDTLTFNYKRGVFAHRAFAFERNTLRSTDISHHFAGAADASASAPHPYETPERIERIRVLGVARSPKSISLSIGNVKSSPLFVYDSDSRVLTIRKPDIPILSDFVLSIA